MAEGPANTEGTARSLRQRLTGDVRARIIAAYALLLLISGLAMLFTVREVLLVRLDERVDDALIQEAGEFRRLATGTDPDTGRPFGEDVDRIFEVFLERNVPDSDEILITVPRVGEPSMRADEDAQEAPPSALLASWRNPTETVRGEYPSDSGPARFLAVPVLDTAGETVGSFVTVRLLARERAQVADSVQIIAIIGGAILIGGAIAIFLLVGRVISPLRELRDATRSVSGSDMTKRIEVRGNDELAELGRTFNGMLDRLELSFATQRGFIRDAGHELRTPISIVRGHLELLAEEDAAVAPERRETYDLLHGELDRMTRFVNDMLLLARSERPDFLQLETVRLGDLIEEVLAKSEALGDRSWLVDATVAASIVADPHRLTQALVNLAGNAVEATEPGAAIAFGSTIEDGCALLWVRDEGHGIDSEDLDDLLKPFRRGRGARYEGSGLGLAIVAAIAQAHEGSIVLTSKLGTGTTVTLRLPVEGPEGDPEEDDIV